jgi:hypothetical protein
MAAQSQGNPWYMAGFVLVLFLLSWHFFTLRSSFDQRGLTEEQLQMMEFNGDIVRAPDGSYAWNPEKEKVSGIPGPLAVLEKAREELSEAFVKKGTNDHGIAYLVFYTVSRFAAGFLAASIVAIMLGVILGLNKVLFRAANPFIQIMKPISPLAWMPLLLYTVKDPKWTAVLVVFMAAVWPTLATTAFGVLDNTFAGFHNHGQFDVDVYLHSLTKYGSGHGDVMGGAIIANAELLAAMRADYIATGAALDPHAAFLIQRGLKTYVLRYQLQCANAQRVAEFLAAQPALTVHYPGLPAHPQHALARAQQQDFGTVVSIELADGAQAKRCAEALQLFAISASLGSTESLVQPGQLMRPRDLNDQERSWAGITDAMLRLSIGIEAVEDLIADLAQALAAS